MPIIIDTNCVPTLFNRRSENFKELEPVLNWILKGKGVMIIGGTKYKEEISKLRNYLGIIRLLKEGGKLQEGDLNEIDNYQRKVERLNSDPDFDDPHLVAIVFVTKCKIICSADGRSVKHVTDAKYYPTNFRKPVYYMSSRNKDLLCDTYVDDSFKPLAKICTKSSHIEKALNRS